MSDPELFEIDSTGDLLLDVSSPTSTRRIRVSSKALCLASPVFRAMLAPSSPFLEAQAIHSNPTAPFEMYLEDDDYASLRLLMSVIHLRTRSVPATITVDALYRLAIVCDKYDAAEIFVPWVDIWTRAFTDITQKPGYERWFAISWVFRLGSIFTKVTRQLVVDMKVCDGGLMTVGGVVEVEIIPDTVIGNTPAPCRSTS